MIHGHVTLEAVRDSHRPVSTPEIAACIIELSWMEEEFPPIEDKMATRDAIFIRERLEAARKHLDSGKDLWMVPYYLAGMRPVFTKWLGRKKRYELHLFDMTHPKWT